MRTAQPPAPREKPVLMTIPEAAAYSGWTVFKIRTLCRSGVLRYSQEGIPFLITREAIRDCIILMEAKTKAKRDPFGPKVSSERSVKDVFGPYK
jgi:hypothetical protein